MGDEPVNAMSRQEGLRAALVLAETALVKAVADAARVDSDLPEANAEVLRARAHCRQLRAALVELNRAESNAGTGEPSDTRNNRLEEASRRSAPARRSSRPPGEHTVPGATTRSSALARPPLLRQSISLFALTFAYLLYFHIDVQLQILRLPSNVYFHTSVNLPLLADGRLFRDI